eukprot:snap_masked-scaffold_20-processed-gene-0.30-mRNA-1 protein AED:1.00 eAED:1.00 QI:0/0/0/0/1/1/2/0/62
MHDGTGEHEFLDRNKILLNVMAKQNREMLGIKGEETLKYIFLVQQYPANISSLLISGTLYVR